MSKKRILMVDDETEYTGITKIYLEDAADFEVHVVNRGMDGYPKAKDVLPDIILLDISMPDVSGYDVARQLAEDPLTKDIPIIFFTGVYSEVDENSEHLKGHPYLTKPTSGEKLIQCIQKHLKD